MADLGRTVKVLEVIPDETDLHAELAEAEAAAETRVEEKTLEVV